MPLRMEVGLGPGYIVLDGDPAPPKGHSSLNFRPMSVVAKLSPISATAERLLDLISASKTIGGRALPRSADEACSSLLPDLYS